MKSVNWPKPGYVSVTCSTISNIPYNLIFATKLATGSGQSAQEVTLLDIALTELSTQVIVKPSQSILVGGLYADSIRRV
jgi:type II secretory pathway component GspD/PulD (secretin)